MSPSIKAEFRRVAAGAFLLVAFILLSPLAAHAQSVTLSWDSSPDPDVVGYTVHVGVNPGTFGQTFDVGPERTFTFNQAVPGQMYYFAVSAYNAENVSSALSNVVTWKINVAPDLGQPAAQVSAVGAAVSLQMTATDDGDPLTFTATGLPPGLSIASNGNITGTPTTAGTYTVGVTVSDGALSDSGSFTWTINPRLSVTSLTSSVASPQVGGSSIVLTAAAAGGVSPYQYKFLQTLGTSTTVVRNWSTSATFTWTPAQAGNYVITVWARSAGVTADVAEASRTLNFSITPPPISITGLSSNLPSPQMINTAITFTSAAAGGSSPYQFKYLLTSGSTTATVRNWGTSALYTWTPTQAGSYVVTVWVRSAGQTADAAEASRTLNYSVTAPFTLTGITSDVPSPRQVGTSITFTGVSSGGATPHQYKWWVHDGIDWRIVRDWAPGTFTWTPTQPNANYRVAVWARAANVTADVSTYNLSISYPITEAPSGPVPTITGLTSNVPSPQVAGTSVTFTAAATGGVAPYQYRFYVWNGSTWTLVRDWNGSSSYTWTPTQANANYRIAVWLRNATTTTDARDADLSVAYPITAPAAGAPLTVAALTSNVQSPQAPGTAVTFTASASGGVAPYQYKFWVSNGSDWMIVRDWSGSSSYTWTPTQANANYRVAVWVRNATTLTDSRDGDLSVAFPITAAAPPPTSGPLTVSGLTSSLPAPQVAGTPITLTATSGGGVGPHQYKFWVWNGIDWSIVRDWSTANTYTWTPAQGNPNYRLAVWARNATTTTDTRDGDGSISFPVTSAAAGGPLSMTSLTSSVPSPQAVGTSVTFTANATGGVAPYQYRFYVSHGTSWTIVRDWSGSNTFTWTPTQANANYRVAVWVRNASNTSDTRDGDLSVSYPITAPASSGPVVVTGLTSNVQSPQVTGTPITFTAAASGGGAPYQYKFWIWTGSVWTIVRDWSGSNTFTWTPTQASTGYRVAVWVRNATTLTDTRDGDLAVPFAITAPASAGPLNFTLLSSNLPAPQGLGATVTFTAVPSGGSGSYQYKWWVWDGIDWRIVRDWSSSSTFAWTPTVANSNYRIGVWVRESSSSENSSAINATMWFPIQR